MGVTSELSEFIASVKLKDVPDRTVTRTKHLILDAIGCALVGARLPWCSAAVRGMSHLETSERGARVWGWGLPFSASSAALINGMFIQGFELDDYHEAGALHLGAAVLPPVLALAEVLGGAAGAAVLEATIAGYEVGPRVGMGLSGLGVIANGWHSGTIFGAIASAAACSRLYGLSAEATSDAVGIAAAQTGGLHSATGASVKRMLVGFGARNGLVGASVAREGVTGPRDVIERDWGGLTNFASGRDIALDRVTSGLGRTWEIDEVVVKPYACLGGCHTTVEAMLTLRERHGLTADDIDAVAIRVGEAIFKHGGTRIEPPISEIKAQMNIAYAAAVSVIDGDASLSQFTPSRVRKADVGRLLERIEVLHDPAIDARGAQARWVAHVTMKLKDGRTLAQTIERPRGSTRPLTNDEIVRRFRAHTRSVIPEARGRAIESMVLALEEQADARELSDLLAHEATSAF